MPRFRLLPRKCDSANKTKKKRKEESPPPPPGVGTFFNVHVFVRCFVLVSILAKVIMDSTKVEEAIAAAEKVAEMAKDKAEETKEDKEEDAAAGAQGANGADKKDPEDPEAGAGAAKKEPEGEKVEFKVIFNKKKYDVTFPLDSEVGALKAHLQPVINIPPAMMKVMIKGLAKDEMTLRKLGVAKGAKVMVVGSSLNDVLSVSHQPSPRERADADAKESKDRAREATSASREKMHKKVLDKGKPEDAMPARKGAKEPLPPAPLSGMLNKGGGKVRLTFKLEHDQLWIGTKERTERVRMSSIKNVVSEPIDGHEEYHILAIQLGPTEQSRYWVYWVPAQYVDAIKDAILGKWQQFL